VVSTVVCGAISSATRTATVAAKPICFGVVVNKPLRVAKSFVARDSCLLRQSWRPGGHQTAAVVPQNWICPK
jgi:hypothetical protein